MAIGKYEQKHPNNQKRMRRNAAVWSILLLLTLAVGGTLAYLVANTEEINNQFVPAYVTCQVNSKTDGSFDITNTGNTDAYIRAAILVNWMDTNGNVRGIAPTATEYSLFVNGESWHLDDETRYYYFENSVAPDNATQKLITSSGITANAVVPDGYTLSIEVVAEAIQAKGDTDDGNIPAYQDAWEISSIGN